MPDSPHARRALLIAHASALLLGGASLFPRILPMPPEQLVTLRTAVAALLLVALALAQRQSWDWLRRGRAVELLGLSALLGGHWWAYFGAIQAGGVATAVVLVYTAPVLTVLLESLLARRRPEPRNLTAGLAVIAGVALIAGPGTAGSATTLALGLLSALLYALRNLWLRLRFQGPPAEALSGAQFALVALLGLPALAEGVRASGPDWGWLLLFGSLFTALPHLGVVFALQRLPASTVSLVTSLEVPYALLFAAVLVGESPTPRLVAGGCSIVAAAWVASRTRI